MNFEAAHGRFLLLCKNKTNEETLLHWYYRSVNWGKTKMCKKHQTFRIKML